MKTITAEDLIQHYQLTPHPEGGYYAQSFKSTQRQGNRACSTAIYFLLTRSNVSKFHRLKSDEVWHFYLGDPLIVVELKEGKVCETRLGARVFEGEKLQYVVPAGTWFGSYLPETSDFSFVGCTVAPGFEFEDFEMAKRESLLGQFPDAKEAIFKLT